MTCRFVDTSYVARYERVDAEMSQKLYLKRLPRYQKGEVLWNRSEVIK